MPTDIKPLKYNGETFYPETSSQAVHMDNSNTLETEIGNIEAAIPTKVSDLTNDLNYSTKSYVDSSISAIPIPVDGTNGRSIHAMYTADLEDLSGSYVIGDIYMTGTGGPTNDLDYNHVYLATSATVLEDYGFYGGSNGTNGTNAHVWQTTENHGKSSIALSTFSGYAEATAETVHLGDLLVTTDGYCAVIAEIVDEPFERACFAYETVWTLIKGANGASGVYVGTDEPTDSDVNVWIDPSGDADVLVRADTAQTLSNAQKQTARSNIGAADATEVSELKETKATDTQLGMIKVGSNLLIDANGVLSVDTADLAEQDNTKPITSAAVHTEIGNITVLLAAI